MSEKNNFPKYHESAAEIDRIQRRREIRQRLQTEYNRIAYNPYRLHHHIEILDPAVSRYSSLRSAIYEYWKPNWKSFWRYAFITYIPIALLSYNLHMKFKKRDEDCRSGKVPYEDRELQRF